MSEQEKQPEMAKIEQKSSPEVTPVVANGNGKKPWQHPAFKAVLASVIILGLLGTAIFFYLNSLRVYIDKAEVSADRIDLSPAQPGPLQELYVQEGQEVPAHFAVARVGDQLLRTEVAGLVVSVQKDFGHIVNPGTAVVSMIKPEDLRIVGRVPEDKGLENIAVGQKTIFTVDAFGGKQFEGVVQTVAPASRSNDIVFSVSDKREVKEFNITVSYDHNTYPDLKLGMSAKMWVYRR